MPEISIIIPAYNRSALLAETLRSCLAQTLTDCETIVVDDGSDEDLAEAVERAGRESGSSHNLRCIRQPRLGANAARNRGLRVSNGSFVQFLDSDDLLHPQKLERLHQALARSPESDMAYGLDVYFRQRPGDLNVLWNVPDEREPLDRFLWDDPVWSTDSPLWRREGLERVGPWDESLVCWQDWEFNIRALCRGIRCLHVPQVLQYVREHEPVRRSGPAAAVEEERSKYRAALAAADDLRSAALWTASRGDALAAFLAWIATGQARVADWAGARASLEAALCFAEHRGLRWTAGLLHRLSRSSPQGVRGRHRLVWFAHRAARALGAVPRYRTRWKTTPRAA